MDAGDDQTTVEVHEPGFDGHLTITGGGGDRGVRVSGTRPQDGANVVKEVPAERDSELATLADRVVRGDHDAAPRLLAHLGILDPPLPDRP
jgi:hypothetical protein